MCPNSKNHIEKIRKFLTKQAQFILQLSVLIAIFLLLVIAFYVIDLLDRPSEDVYHTVQFEQALTKLQNRFDNLEMRLFPEDRFLSDFSCDYGPFQPENNTIPITLSFQPNASFAKFEEAILHCNETNIPLVLKDGSFTATYATNIFEIQNISAITFADDEILQTEPFSWTIDPSDQVIPKLTSVARVNLNGKTGDSLNYSGSLHVSVIHFPEGSGKIKEISLIKVLDGKVETQSPIKYQFQNQLLKTFTINKKVRGKIPDGSTLELIIELVDEYGLRYQCLLQRLDSAGNGLWEQIRQTKIYSKDGTFLYNVSN